MRSRFVFVSLGAVLASVLSACASGEPGTDPSSAEPTSGVPVPPTISHMPATDACRASRVKATEFSTSVFDWRLTFSPDRQTAFWAVSDRFFPSSRQAKIVTARYEGGAWSAPEDAPFSGPTYTDMDPALSPDGQTLFFSSIRPVDGAERQDLDLWSVAREGDGWGDPVHLGAVNSPRDELYPSVTADGTLYFGSDRDGQWDIYRSRPQADGTYGEPERLNAPVNSDRVWEFNPDISPDGQTLVFTMLSHPNGLGAGDIYLARRNGDGFDVPINLGECINSTSDTYHPTVVWDDEPVLYFVQDGDFFRADLPQG